MKRHLSILSVLFFFSRIHYVDAGVAIVVNPDVDTDVIDIRTIANIFLGKSSKLPNGLKVTPIDQQEGEDPRKEFYKKVARKDSSQLNAYWSRLIFTGKGQPPKVVLDDEEVIGVMMISGV